MSVPAGDEQVPLHLSIGGGMVALALLSGARQDTLKLCNLSGTLTPGPSRST